MMEKYKQIVNSFFWSFIVDGVVAITTGALIFLWPDLVGMTIGVFLVFVGVKGVFFAFKLKRFLQV